MERTTASAIRNLPIWPIQLAFLIRLLQPGVSEFFGAYGDIGTLASEFFGPTSSSDAYSVIRPDFLFADIGHIGDGDGEYDDIGIGVVSVI